MEKLILLVSEYLCLYQMELPEYNNIVMKIMLEKHFIRDASATLLQRIFHIIATAASRKYAALLSAHTWGFQLALVETWPDCCYLQLHIQPVFFFFIKYFFI